MIVTFMPRCLHHEPIQEVFDPPAEWHDTAHGAATCDMALYHQDRGAIRDANITNVILQERGITLYLFFGPNCS